MIRKLIGDCSLLEKQPIHINLEDMALRDMIKRISEIKYTPRTSLHFYLMKYYNKK